MNITTELQPTEITHQVDLSDSVKILESWKILNQWRDKGYDVTFEDHPENPLIRVIRGILHPPALHRIITPTKSVAP